MKREILNRADYTDHIQRMFGRGIIVALTGQRRVGKSCVMRSIKEKLAHNEDNHLKFPT